MGLTLSGSGKTYLACLASYRMLNYTPTKKILFLVDRNNLARQTESEFSKFDRTEGRKEMSSIYEIKRLKQENDIKADIVISTIQKLFAILTGQTITEISEDAEDEKTVTDEGKDAIEAITLGDDLKLPPDYFQFIIVDECQRCFTREEVQRSDNLDFRWLNFEEEDDRTIFEIMTDMKAEADNITNTISELDRRLRSNDEEQLAYEISYGRVPFSIKTALDNVRDSVNSLRKRIIDEGIKENLSDQLDSDGTAEELYLCIQEERKKQQQLGGIKFVGLLPEVDECDIPFSIPNNWKWTRLGNISYIVRGGSPRPIKKYITNSENGTNWIKISDVEKGGKYITETREKIIPEGEKKSRKVYPGDFLLTNSMSYGRPYISKIEGCIHDGWLLIHNLNGFDQDYLYYLLSSEYLYNQFTQKASGSTVDNLNIDKVSSAIIPLPPLAEQRRIANRIEEFLQYCQ